MGFTHQAQHILNEVFDETSRALRVVEQGDAARSRLISVVHAVAGGADNVRLLWLPKITDTTTTVSAEKDARTFTYDATIAARLSALGSGMAVSFNGTSQYASAGDDDDFTFGDGLNDTPFSVVALVKITDTAAQRDILTKYDVTTAALKREWRLFIGTDDKVSFQVWDESILGRQGRKYNTAVAADTWVLLTGTYDGSRYASGLSLYVNEARVDDTDDSAGALASMEPSAATVLLGAETGAAAIANYFSGSMAFVALIARQLQQDEIYAIMAACNSHFGLSLS